MKRHLVAVVAAQEAERLRQELQARGLVDRSVRMAKRGAEVLIPLAGEPPKDLARFGARLESEVLSSRLVPQDPHASLRQALALAGIPEEAGPRKWERIGDVLVLRLSNAARPYAQDVGRVYGETLRCRTVVEDVSGVHGILRTPEVRVLWGDGTETVHLEGGVRYKLDVARIMFSSGNLSERTSIASKVHDGAAVVDLFAGIGYFTLPIAVHARPERIYACELNPVAFHYLLENLRLNRATNVIPLLGDCRDTAPRSVADVVLMGHFSAADYLDVAFDTLRGAGLVVYHELCSKEQFPQAPLSHVVAAAKDRWYDVESVHSKILKSYAPGIVHAVLEARVRRRPKTPMAR